MHLLGLPQDVLHHGLLIARLEVVARNGDRAGLVHLVVAQELAPLCAVEGKAGLMLDTGEPVGVS